MVNIELKIIICAKILYCEFNYFFQAEVFNKMHANLKEYPVVSNYIKKNLLNFCSSFISCKRISFTNMIFMKNHINFLIANIVKNTSC